MEKIKNFIERKHLAVQLRKLDSLWTNTYGTCFSEVPSFYLTHTQKEIETCYQRLHEKIKELEN